MPGDSPNYGDQEVRPLFKKGSTFTEAIIESINGKDRILVDIGAAVSLTESRYRPKCVANNTDISVPASGSYTMLNQSINGKLEFISVFTDSEKFDIELLIDSIQVYRLNFKAMSDDYRLRSDWYPDLSTQFIEVSNDKRQFFDAYAIPADIATNIQIKLYNTDTSTRHILASLIKLREKIV